MANIVLKTFAAGDEGQGTVTPQDDALIYQNAVSTNGIFEGATVTLTGANTLHITSGFGIICGRFFEINESDVSVQLSSSGTLSGRLKIHLDLNNADNPIEIVTETGATLPALSGDSNININGGAFDMELCTFSVNELTISSLANTFPTIDNTSKQVRRKTAYAVNDFVLCQSASNALIFICTTAGTTAVQEPTAYATVTDGNTVTDGTAVFKAVSVSGQITQISKIGNLSSLTTTDKTSLVNAVNEVDDKVSKTEVLISNSGDAYDPTKAYAVGDLCIYNDTLYRCTTACSAGSWATNQSCFTVDTLVNILKPRKILDDGGIRGSEYIAEFHWHQAVICGETCCLNVSFLASKDIPAWTNFLTIKENYQNSNIRTLRIAAVINQSSNFTAIAVAPNTGNIATLANAISGNTNVSFYVTYPLPKS